MTEQSSAIGRIWNAWSRFWFTPTDPTPLCLMRIVAGILTLYVHLAYSIDLVDFYGPNGWCSQKEANKARAQMPHYLLRFDWKQEDQTITMPYDLRQRVLLRQFMHNVLADSSPGSLLDFLGSMALLPENDRTEILRFLEQWPDAAVLNNKLQEFLDNKMTDEESILLPRLLTRQPTLDMKKRFADELRRFNNQLPTQTDDRRSLIQLFLVADQNGWGILRAFISHLGEMPAGERDPYIDYVETWSFPPERAYAKGWHTYSPWFHTTDVRFLWLIHGLHLFVILLFTLGMYTRVTSVMTWLVGLSYIHRAQPYLFGQDTMMTLCLLYLSLSPCGAKWSFDRWMIKQRAKAAGVAPPPVALSVSACFALRVFQIQYCFMYLSAGVSKLKGTAWWNGTAFYLCMANPEFAPMHLAPYRDFVSWICDNRVVFELKGAFVSLFTLVTEISFPFIVWTGMRPVAVSAALLLHLGIAMIMGLSVFSLFMFCLLLCFVPADAINWMFDPEAYAAKSAESPKIRQIR